MHYDHQHRASSTQTKTMSQTSTMSPDTNFNYFRKLPAEIRTTIWEYSLPEPRVYEVLDAPHATQRTKPQAGLLFANVHPEPPPALSAVCRESRYFVLHHYKPLTLGTTTKYVDLSRDILLLEPYLQIKRLHRTLHFMSQIPLVRDSINRLALGTSYGIYTGICHPVMNWKLAKTNVPKLLASLGKFPRLKTLVFIVHQEFQFEFDFRIAGQSISTHHNTHHPPLHPVSTGAVMAGNPLFINNLRNPLPPPTTTLMPLSLPPGQHQQRPQQQQILPTTSSQQPGVPPPSPAQQVHQAYRFKFDIESNINHTPRRPHLNELLYYPLDYDEEADDFDLNDPEDEEGEWCDPWPTNDDWRRFRRRWVRAVRVGLAAEEGEERCGEKRSWGGGGGGKGGGGGDKRVGDGGGKRQRLSVPSLKGASLLWRYTKGGMFDIGFARVCG